LKINYYLDLISCKHAACKRNRLTLLHPFLSRRMVTTSMLHLTPQSKCW